MYVLIHLSGIMTVYNSIMSYSLSFSQKAIFKAKLRFIYCSESECLCIKSVFIFELFISWLLLFKYYIHINNMYLNNIYNRKL